MTAPHVAVELSGVGAGAGLPRQNDLVHFLALLPRSLKGMCSIHPIYSKREAMNKQRCNREENNNNALKPRRGIRPHRGGIIIKNERI